MVEYTKSFGIDYNKIKNYRPPPGMNLNVYEVDNETLTAMAQFIINSEHPDPRYRRYKEDIDRELSNIAVAIDNVRNRPRGQQMHYQINADSITKDMDYLRKRVNVKTGDLDIL